MTLKKAISRIERRGALLAFPLHNRKEPASLWSEFFPRSKMLWEWDEDGDTRVSDLWRLRERLSVSEKVIYTKWYKGRATFFSRPVFVALLSLFQTPFTRAGLTRTSQELLDILEGDSPLSTKQLKALSGLQGRFHEPTYMRGLKELWARLYVVAFGEVDEGAFPSLALGASKLLFEDLWLEARGLSARQAHALLSAHLPPESLFYREALKIKARVEGSSPGGHAHASSTS